MLIQYIYLFNFTQKRKLINANPKRPANLAAMWLLKEVESVQTILYVKLSMISVYGCDLVGMQPMIVTVVFVIESY